MNRKASILLLALATSAAFAQTTKLPAKVASALAQPASASAANAVTPSIPAASTPHAAKPLAKRPVEDSATSKAGTFGESVAARKGKRDPFVSPVSDRVKGGSGCSIGKKCLVADQVNLQGVVKGPNGMIAVVVNSAQKAYFMRENDPVFQGYVVKITPDSIVFRETTQDRMGKPVSRDIVKRVNTPAV